MLQVNPFAIVPQGVSFNAEAGASAGGAASSSAGTGASAGSASGASASGGGTGGGVSAVNLSDETPVTIGGKTYGSFKEYSSGYVPRSEYDSAKTATTDQIKASIQAIARAQQAGQNVRQNPQQQQRQDPFAGVRDLPFVDGKTLEAMSKTALGPIAEAINNLQQHVARQNQTIQQLRGGVAPLAERHSSQEFEKRIQTGVSAAIPGVDMKDPFVSELAQDVFHSYEWAKGKEDAEYQKYLGDRYKSAEAHFKAKFRAELDAAKNRKWQKPGGNATASGPAQNPLARATPQQIARNVFAGSGANT
jgi:hypothetical protein